MNVMVLDAEFNQPSRKCIQIGAAIYDARSADLIARFETYVDPGEMIEPFITTLTGITDRDVYGAPMIKDAYLMLKEFHAKHKCFRNPLVWGSGVRNDSSSIYEQTGLTEDNFMGFRVLDVKTIYQSMAIFENSQYAGGLKDICKKLGVEWEGQAHTALADAMMTFKVWYKLMRIMHDGKKMQKKS